jgi:hypothetical protein
MLAPLKNFDEQRHRPYVDARIVSLPLNDERRGLRVASPSTTDTGRHRWRP